MRSRTGRSEGRILTLTAYHASPQQVKKFDLTKASKSAVWGPALYADFDPERAVSWVGMHGARRGYLHTLVLTTSEDRIADITKPAPERVYERIEEGLDRRVAHEGALPLMTLERRFGSVAEGLGALGFDAVIHQGPGGHGKHVAFLRPDRVAVTRVEPFSLPTAGRGSDDRDGHLGACEF